jgi:hypothetical protein
VAANVRLHCDFQYFAQKNVSKSAFFSAFLELPPGIGGSKNLAHKQL